jgi:putative DNA primase/helicase
MRTWHDVGIALHYGATGKVRTICPQCSHTRDKPRDACLSIDVDRGLYYCFYCGWKGGLSGHETYDHHFVSSSPQARDPNKHDTIRHTWHQAKRMTAGDPVHTYLYRRGLIFNDTTTLPAVLRYHPSLKYWDDNHQWTRHPAMLARVDDPHGQVVSLHRTYLTHDGRKANVPNPKKLMAPVRPGATKGGAIRLYEATDILGVAEGIETALAAHLATTVPTWATLSAIGMEMLHVPKAVRQVIIFADHDRAGLKAARALAQRMLLQQRQVKILTPDTPGLDWADIMEDTHGD